MALAPDLLNYWNPLKSSNTINKNKESHLHYLQEMRTSESLSLHATIYTWAARQIPQGWALDMGCEYGFGSMLAMESNPELHVLGMDLDITALRYSKDNLFVEEIPLVNANVNNSPFLSETFSGIFMINLLHLVEKPTRVLTDTKRLLKPGGFAFISIPRVDPRIDTEMKTSKIMRLKLLLSIFFSEVIYPDEIFGQLPSFSQRSFQLDHKAPIWMAMCRK